MINKRSNLKTRPTVGPIHVGLQNIQNRTSIALSRHADLLRQRLLAENYPLFRTAKTDSSILFRVSLTHLLSAPKQWAGKAGSSPFSCSLHFFHSLPSPPPSHSLREFERALVTTCSWSWLARSPVSDFCAFPG